MKGGGFCTERHDTYNKGEYNVLVIKIRRFCPLVLITKARSGNDKALDSEKGKVTGRR